MYQPYVKTKIFALKIWLQENEDLKGYGKSFRF